MRAVNLKTEYLRNPIGIDITEPRFYWQCEGGIKQSAYQIVAKDEKGNLLWDSGKVQSDSMTHIKWQGKSLGSRDLVRWCVKLWNEKGNEGEFSEEATFELGLLSKEDWKAKWITGNYTPKKSKRYPVDCFRKEFTLKKDIAKARLYVTACGLYEISLDGKKVGDFCLAPGVTDYRKRVQYQTYDVIDMLKEGKNTITALLADGWYRGSVGAWGLRNQYGTQTKFILQLEITYKNGDKDYLLSGDSWDWSDDGCIISADNKDGEIVDANLTPSYSGKAKITSHKVTPTASNNVFVKEKENFKLTLITSPTGKKILEFPENIAGYISFKVNANKGNKITLRFGEMLDEKGELTQKNIQLSMGDKTTPLQRVEYTCKEGLNSYKTKFAIFGFKYAEVEADFEFSADDFTAYAVYSDFEQTTHFTSSNELLNRFVEATCRSTKGNSTDLPTDCPTRERHGWTGDAQIFCETANYLFDYVTFSKKYIRDMYDWQLKSGRLPHIVPDGGADFYMWVMNGSVGWADAGILMPYRLWKLYGDREIIVEYYDRMMKYARFMMKRCGKTGPMAPVIKGISLKNRRYLVNCGQSYGEWAEPTDVHIMKWTDCAVPHAEVSTAYTAYVLSVMAEISEELGKNDDAALLKKYSDGCKNAYQELVETKAYTLNTDRQAQLVRPLAFGLLNEKQTEFAKERLIKALENYGFRLGTGFLSTPLILDVLAEFNIDSAYRLLENEEMPGWLFMTKNGATTVWESWEGTEAQGGIASLNHYSKGAVCQWLFKTMCGIRMGNENEFIIEPKPGGSFTFAQTEYDSIYGRIKCRWDKTDETYKYSISVPSNTVARVTLPDGRSETLSSGEYVL